MIDVNQIMNSKVIPNEISVIDNFLPEEYFKKLQFFMLSQNFPWFRNFGVTDENDGHRQFTHTFYKDFQANSNLIGEIDLLIKKIKPIAIFRIKANLLPPTHEIFEFDYHVDYQQPCVTSILYMSTTNGYTKFKTGEKIGSVENRFVSFPSNLEHAGTTSSDGQDRVVINLNYIPDVPCW